MADTSQIRSALRRQMPVASKFAYLDHAAVAPLTQRSAEAINHFAEQATHEGDTRWLDWDSSVIRTRRLAATLIGAAPSEVALVANTTQGISIVAEGLPWQPGDNVVVPKNEFPSNLLPWRNLQRRGVELRLVEPGADGSLQVSNIMNCVDRRTRLVATSWVGFASGFRLDVGQLSDAVHSLGSLLLVDAIQGLGAFPLDVKAANIDFMAADGHKWMLGPEGAGMLFIAADHLNLLTPLAIGWHSLAVGGFDPASVQLKETAQRFEGGSANMVGMMAFGESLAVLTELGTHLPDSGFDATILENVAELEELLKRADFEVDLPSAAENRSGILGVRWQLADQEGEAAYNRARKFLLAANVVSSVRAGRIRVATHAYNNGEDHGRLVDALKSYRERST